MTMNRTNVLSAILIIVLFATAYVWYSYIRSGSESAVAPAVSGTAAAPNLASNEFLALLKKLETINIDASFFENPLFQKLQKTISLEDIGIPQPKGQRNPFLPLR